MGFISLKVTGAVEVRLCDRCVAYQPVHDLLGPSLAIIKQNISTVLIIINIICKVLEISFIYELYCECKENYASYKIGTTLKTKRNNEIIPQSTYKLNKKKRKRTCVHQPSALPFRK